MGWTRSTTHSIGGYRCVVCGADVAVTTFGPWQCPRRTPADPYHVLALVPAHDRAATIEHDNPLIRYGPRSAWWAFGAGHGIGESDLVELVGRVAGDHGSTPFARSDALSTELGADVWVKDETGNVAGSHKARHLVGILLHLVVAEELGLLTSRPPLAIASCGNAALAAATLSSRVGWPLDVYVPTWMDPAFGTRLDELGARIHRCERRREDPAGDPSMLRFREAVAAGAIPFSVQGPENALCLDTGRTIGWEIADRASRLDLRLDRIVVQVGGGAFAACVGAGLGHEVRLDTVQAEGCAPLAAAWERAGHVEHPERAWPEVMRPWPDPHSAADGILDDETYDWLAVTDAMRASGGAPVVATEDEILEAHSLARAAGYDVSVTGSAGLAGLLHVRRELRDDERIAVVMSGVHRT